MVDRRWQSSALAQAGFFDYRARLEPTVVHTALLWTEFDAVVPESRPRAQNARGLGLEHRQTFDFVSGAPKWDRSVRLFAGRRGPGHSLGWRSYCAFRREGVSTDRLHAS